MHRLLHLLFVLVQKAPRRQRDGTLEANGTFPRRSTRTGACLGPFVALAGRIQRVCAADVRKTSLTRAGHGLLTPARNCALAVTFAGPSRARSWRRLARSHFSMCRARPRSSPKSAVR